MQLLTGDNVRDLPISVLKEELEKRGLSTDGVKVVLIVRLNKAIQSENFATHEDIESEEPGPSSNMSHDNTLQDPEAAVGDGEEKKALKVDTNELDESHDLEIVDEPDAEEKEDNPEDADDVEYLNSGDVQDEEEPDGEDEFEEEEVDDDVVAIEQETEDVVFVEQKPQEEVPVIQEPPIAVVKPEEEKEEEEEDKEKKAEEKPMHHSSPEDEIFLDYEEDLLDDPLLEQQEEPKKEDTAPEDASTPADTTASDPNVGQGQEQQQQQSSTSSETSRAPVLFAEDSKKTSIWIRGMEPSTKASSVKQLASQYGKVIQAKIFNSRPSTGGDIKNCFALVTFADTAAMELAITSLQKKNYQGRILRVEKVSESHLTGSAERIAQEKLEAENRAKKPVETPTEPPKKKQRVTITAPEATPPKKPQTPHSTQKARQTIQAPSDNNNVGEKRTKRPQIQPPPRSSSREKPQQKRKPITYERSPGNEEDDELATERESPERDSRRIIAPARPSRVQRSPVRANSRQSGRGGGQAGESLIISARVDTSNCRGGGITIKRSVERIVPNNISTSQLRRNAAPPQHHAPRASYQTEQYSREREQRGVKASPASRKSPTRAQTRRSGERDRGDSRGRQPSQRHQDHHSYQEEYVYEDEEVSGRRRRRDYEEPQQQPKQRRQAQHDDTDAKAREMMALLKRKEEEHLIREERLQIQREKERIRFEVEKLERTRLELELAKQKMALEQAAMAIAASGDRHRAGGGGGVVEERGARGKSSSAAQQDSGSRRRQATNVLTGPQAAKVSHQGSSSSKSGVSSGRRGAEIPSQNQTDRQKVSYSSNSGSSRHAATATTYGIQTGGSRTTSDYTRLMEQPQQQTRGSTGHVGSGGGSGNYRTSSTSSFGSQMNDFAGYGYADTGAAAYQQVWQGLDAHGHMSSNETNWTTGATPSSSTSSGAQWGHHQNNYNNNNSSSSRRDYGYQRNNY